MKSNILSHLTQHIISYKLRILFCLLFPLLKKSFLLNFGSNSQSSPSNLDFIEKENHIQNQRIELRRFMYVLLLFITFDFGPKFLVTVTGGNPKKTETTRNDSNVHESAEFYMLILNMVFFFYKI
jgi:hypothetical protein